MQLIKPSEIGGKIMTLLEEASGPVTLVSPYNNIGDWPRMRRAIRSVADRGHKVTLYHRDDSAPLGLEGLQVTLVPVVNLHAKIYINPDRAIISSMNLTHRSTEISLDIAYETTTSDELEELLDYCRRYLQEPTGKTPTDRSEDGGTLWMPYFRRDLPDEQQAKLTLTMNVHDGTAFIREYGFTIDGTRSGPWLFFDDSGRLRTVQVWDRGQCSEEDISYDSRKRLSLYYLVFTVTNMARGLYGGVPSHAYFNTLLSDIAPDGGLRLAQHVREHLGVSVNPARAATVSSFADQIQMLLLGYRAR